jgi:hypothetical protein
MATPMQCQIALRLLKEFQNFGCVAIEIQNLLRQTQIFYCEISTL